MTTSNSNGAATGDFVIARHRTGAEGPLSAATALKLPIVPALCRTRMVRRVETQWCQVGPSVGW
jgi:hypothetical protein